MERRIRITAGPIVVEGTIERNPVADAFWSALPIQGRAQLWGDEIYFRVPVDAPEDPESERETVDLGSIGFWPPGNALCLFFGRTPMSLGEEIRPASAVNQIGMMKGDPLVLRKVPSGCTVTVQPVNGDQALAKGRTER